MHLLAWVLVWVCCAAVALWSLVALPLSAIFGTQRRAWRLAAHRPAVLLAGRPLPPVLRIRGAAQAPSARVPGDAPFFWIVIGY